MSTGVKQARWRWSFIDDLQRATPTIRLLVLTQLTFNVGFFMVLPYLSVHLTSDLGLGAALVGVVLGVRTFSQQGLFFIGGTLADRWGIKPVVLVGCVLRVLGFVGLAFFDSLTGVLVATVLVGFAAALFSPAVESAVAIEAGKSESDGGPRRVETFALLSVCSQIGSFTGPLVGSLLLLVDFRLACLVAAAIFLVIVAAHVKWLPNEPGEHRDDPWLSGWTDVVRNKLFVLFAVAMSAQLVAYNQLYLLLPLEVERAGGSQTVLGWFFAISAVFVVTAQLPITRATARRSPRVVIPVGFAVMAVSFVVVAATSPLQLEGFVGLVPAAMFVLLLALGQMLADRIGGARCSDRCCTRRRSWLGDPLARGRDVPHRQRSRSAHRARKIGLNLGWQQVDRFSSCRFAPNSPNVCHSPYRHCASGERVRFRVL